MKIIKTNLIHLLIVFILFLNVLINLLVQQFLNTKKNNVVLYGHKLSGNLLTIYEKSNYFFLCLDYSYFKKLKRQNKRVFYALNPMHMFKFLNSKIIIVSHGLFFIDLIKLFSEAKIINVWHGLPNKLVDESFFNKFDENWIYSDFQKKLFKNLENLDQNKLIVTGYGRLEKLLVTKNEITPKKFLIANSWSNFNNLESSELFSINNPEFLKLLNYISINFKCSFIIKPHINQKFLKRNKILINSFKNVNLSISDDLESLINSSDALFTDWSSIMFDYIYTNKSVYLLNNKKSFSGEANPIFNEVNKKRIQTYEDFKQIFLNPTDNKNIINIQQIKLKVLNKELEGQSTKNYLARINYLLKD